MSLKNKKIAEAWEDISDVYDKVREYIEDERYLQRFDRIMDVLDTEDEMENFFEEIVFEYLNDEVAPDGYEFGIHAKSGDIGFWRVNKKTGESDLPYPGMKKPSPTRLLHNPEEEEEEEEHEEVELEDPKEKKEGVAEILDEKGEVVAHTPFREGTSESDPSSLEESKEAEVV